MKTTAEEFFREKIKQLNPLKEHITLSQESITAEQGMRWAHEYAMQCKSEAIDETVKACAEAATTELTPTCIRVDKSSILKVAEQLKAKL